MEYQWQRFWVEIGKEVKFDTSGFLFESFQGSGAEGDLKTFDEISSKPCLILIGERGIGKSRTLRSEFDKKKIETGDGALFFDLKEYVGERTINHIFKAPELLKELSTNTKIFLFLDSLDEYREHNSNAANDLLFHLSSLPSIQINLRIACRSSDWRELGYLEDGLKKKFNLSAIPVYQLAPLTRNAILKAAEQEGCNPYEFIAEVQRTDTTSLAISPLNLQFLFEEYKRDGCIASIGKRELFFKGLKRLCEEEKHSSRVASKKVSPFSSNELLEAAMWIAALMLLSGHSKIDTNEEKNSDSISPLDYFIDGSPQTHITRAKIKSVCETGLFTSSVDGLAGWRHQSFADFLAANYLSSPQIPITQLKDLILISIRGQTSVIPALREMSIWLASMREDFFDLVLEIDPELLALTEIFDERRRKKLVDQLLKRLSIEGWISNSSLRAALHIYKRFTTLKHADIEAQLKSWICDTSRNKVARGFAIDIAEDCQLLNLVPDLVSISLDNTDNYEVRRRAVAVACHLGDELHKRSLLPLIAYQISDDPLLELKACALRATWPTLLSAEELFRNLLPYQKRNYFGTFDAFIRKDIVTNLRNEDVLIALNWLYKLEFPSYLSSPFTVLSNSLLIKALENANSPEISERLAEVIIKLYSENYHIFHEDIDYDARTVKNILINLESQRQKILAVLLRKFIENEMDHVKYHMITRELIVKPSDVKFLIYNFQRASSSEKKILIHTILHFRELTPEIFDEVWELKDDETAKSLLNNIYEVKLNSDYAKLQRKLFEESENPKGLQQENSADTSRIQLHKYIQDSQNSDKNNWLEIYFLLEEISRGKGSFLLDKVPTYELNEWNLLTENEKATCIKSAQKYLKNCPALSLDKLWPKNSTTPTSISIYQALSLIFFYKSQEALTLGCDQFVNFFPALPSLYWFNEIKREPWVKTFLDEARQCADKLEERISSCIEHENKIANSLCNTLVFLDLIWNNRVKQLIEDIFLANKLRLELQKDIADFLLGHKSERAKDFVREIISKHEEGDNEFKAEMAFILFKNGCPSDWELIWQILQNNLVLGKEVAKIMAFRDQFPERRVSSKRINELLSESQIFHFYGWLERCFPYSTNPVHEGVYSPNWQDNVVEFKNSLLQLLSERGTLSALEELEKLKSQFPDVNELSWFILKAQELTLKKQWEPPKTRDIINLLADSQKRLVSNGDQLLSLIVGIIKGFEQELHGELSLNFALWNEKGKKFTPKDEERLSDLLAWYLNKELNIKGIFANREAQIRRGQLTDIHIDAYALNAQSFKLIIEVKGSWNKGLFTAMESQLLKKYLSNNTCKHAIYLTGHFVCDKWDKEDQRLTSAQSHGDINSLREKLSEQASKLSSRNLTIESIVLDATLL